MRLLFTNCSKQKKLLIETDYIEDIYDEVEIFFEDHKIRPYYIDIRKTENAYEVWYGSMSERFIIEDMDDGDASILRGMYQ